jgi:hypothetical protein
VEASPTTKLNACSDEPARVETARPTTAPEATIGQNNWLATVRVWVRSADPIIAF